MAHRVPQYVYVFGMNMAYVLLNAHHNYARHNGRNAHNSVRVYALIRIQNERIRCDAVRQICWKCKKTKTCVARTIDGDLFWIIVF